MPRSVILAAILLPLLVGTAAVSIWVWRQLGDIEMGLHGWIALGLGALFTLVIGGGLMALVFYSHRRGYDARVGTDAERGERR
jgi:hypothetical protein